MREPFESGLQPIGTERTYKNISKLLTQAENRLIELNSNTVVRVELSEPALENLGL
jgi:arabinogalactan endo-1,4-beta-galactosidase